MIAKTAATADESAHLLCWVLVAVSRCPAVVRIGIPAAGAALGPPPEVMAVIVVAPYCWTY